MPEPKPLASLTAGLLARKGAARPAMRPQLLPQDSQPGRVLSADLPPPTPAEEAWHDLGWNDMGLAEPGPGEAAAAADIAADAAPAKPAAVIPITPATAVIADPAEPPVRRQQAAITRTVARDARRSALAEGRRAAFTLRLDAERHLRLRLACTLGNQSAQQVVTEALDRLLGDLPELDGLAAQVARGRNHTDSDPTNAEWGTKP
jgi:hypothetical protein